MSYAEYGIGATTVGIRVKDGVVLASEKRVSYGGFIVSKAGKKVFKVTDRIGIAFAGLYADMQALARILSAEIQYYEVSTGKPARVYAAAKLLSNILYASKLIPFITEVLVGGVDETGSHLYVMDPVGSVIEDDYAALGSGAAIAIGILEANYRKDMSVDEAKELAEKAVRIAIERDAISGDGIDILVIKRIDGRIVAIEESKRIATSGVRQ